MIYNKYSSYLKSKFGVRVHKISVDAGFGCPNNPPCIYCDNKSFNFSQKWSIQNSLKNQIETGIIKIKKRFDAEKFILYFQAGTNAFADMKILKETFEIIKNYEDFVGLNIATRPDAVNEEILEFIATFANDYEVFVEYGLQSIHDETLTLINRGHDFEKFISTYELTKKFNLKVCVHLILGLPNETENLILQTAKMMTKLKVDAVKLHPMHIVKNTKLAEIYKNFSFDFLDFEKYLEILANFLVHLDENIVILGLNGYCPKHVLFEPKWMSNYNLIVESLDEYMISKNLKQGLAYV